MKIAPSRSLSSYLLRWLLGVLVLIWAVQASVAWLTGWHEAQEITDGQLVSVARLWSGMEGPAAPAANWLKPPEPVRDYVQDVAVLRWRQGLLMDDTHGLAALLPPELPAGFSELTIQREGQSQAWRAYQMAPAASAAQERLVVLMSLEHRWRLTRDLAGHMSAPTLVLMPLSLALLALALRRGLAPLNALSGDIRALTGRPGERLQKPPHFKEFNSTVHALHGLMQRLEQQIERERAFASDLAHELRTPLTALSLQASQLAQQEVPGAQALQSQALRAGDILSQLLTLARAERMDAASRQTLDLHSLAASTLADMAQLALDHGQELWLEDAGAEVKVQASPLAVDLALRNLIDNALKHTPPGSRIKVGVWRESGQQGLAVEDQPGPGSTPPAPKPGLGLGLQLVQRLAASQSATLEIQSTAGGRRCRLAWAEEPTHTG